MKEIQVNKTDSGQRFDKYLKRILPEMGTGFMYKMLRKKNITLNDKKATGSELIQTGDIVKCFFSDETFDKFSGKEITDTHSVTKEFASEYTNAYTTLKGIKVIYEDEHILLLDKPAGVLSQKANPADISLNEWMIGYLLHTKALTQDSLKHFKPSVCNRLDRNTSGLVICGKTLLGSREMSRILKDRSLQKFYRTYVHGHLEGEKTLEGYHSKKSKNNQATVLFTKPMSDAKEYDVISTAYRSLEAKEQYSYLEIELITGKTHQIRAHLSAIGHPIVGDRKYGDAIKSNATGNSTHKHYPKYQLLHAYRIVFPKLEGELAYLSDKEFVCEEPKAFTAFYQNLFTQKEV